jgi:hypothetical protein
MFGIEIDSIVIFHYLCYLTNSGLSKHKNKADSLKNLMQTVLGNPKSWIKYFFESTNSKDLERANLYRKWVLIENDMDEKNDSGTFKLLNNLRKDPFGNMRQCLNYTFRRNSSVKHTDLALILIGYSFELENKLDFASAFYWVSFILEQNRAVSQHLRRVCPLFEYLEYLYNLYGDIDDMATSIQFEIGLIPVIVEAFHNIMRSYIYVGLFQEADFQESTFSARCYVCLLNALVTKMDRQKSKPLEVFSNGRRIVQANKNSIVM